MESYNTLYASILCRSCTYEFDIVIQFKYGTTGGQYEYVLGNELKEVNVDAENMPNRNISIFGVADDGTCPYCRYLNEEKFKITIYDNVLSEISNIKGIQPYHPDDNGNFYETN
jgi:hypothetical protein